MGRQYRVDTASLSRDSKQWLKRQEARVWDEVEQAFSQIAQQPRGNRPTYRHLKGPDLCLWCLRLHAIRLVYDIDDAESVIGILRVRPRKDVYDQR